MLQAWVVRSAYKRARRRRNRAFTLVELAVVVAIVGILAVIAVVGYRRYILHSKITEAQTVISAIRLAQEDHKAERGVYADIGTTFCPTLAGVADKKVAWDTSCGTGGTWKSLPVHIDGPVQFTYATVASTAAFSGSPLGTTWVTWGTHADPWYVVAAKCDLDGVAGGETELAGSSFTNTIFSHNEGM
jgi:type IV pilus assembly protein PilA